MKNPPNILAIGCGNMAGAILKAYSCASPEARIVAIDKNPSRAKKIIGANSTIQLFGSFDSVSDFAPDIVLLGIKPQGVSDLSKEKALRLYLQDAVLVSILAGVPIKRLNELFCTASVARVMPNLPVTIGKGASAGFENSLSPYQKKVVHHVFSGAGYFEWLAQENLIDVFTAIYGSGPGYIFSLVEHLENVALKFGLPEKMAHVASIQLVSGCAEMLETNGQTASQLKSAITSKGGTTEAGLSVWEKRAAIPRLLSDTINSALQRAKELSQ